MIVDVVNEVHFGPIVVFERGFGFLFFFGFRVLVCLLACWLFGLIIVRGLVVECSELAQVLACGLVIDDDA